MSWFSLPIMGKNSENTDDFGHARNLYNETVRIPFFIRLPEAVSATHSKEIASLVDVAPTLLAIAGGKSAAIVAGTRIDG